MWERKLGMLVCPREAGGHTGDREVAPEDDSSVFMGILVPWGEAWTLVLGIEV